MRNIKLASLASALALLSGQALADEILYRRFIMLGAVTDTCYQVTIKKDSGEEERIYVTGSTLKKLLEYLDDDTQTGLFLAPDYDNPDEIAPIDRSRINVVIDLDNLDASSHNARVSAIQE